MDTRTQSPVKGQMSLTMQERMRLLESTTKKAEEGQEVLVKSPTKEEEGDVAGFMASQAAQREEDEGAPMLEVPQ